jgi:redox-sensitive bicupin YhaK (pirin superfamily)
VIVLHRAAERYRSEQPGIVSWHCFSSGAHYDPANLRFGPLIALDEHVVDPGAGFAEHAHSRVELISWVLAGILEHRDRSGRKQLVGPGDVQYQLAGDGIRHIERNASSLEPLRFVQLWLMTDEELPGYDVAPPPTTLCSGRFDVLTRCRSTRLDAALLHLYVGTGNFHVAGHDLAAGDSVRATGAVEVDGEGELLVVELAASPLPGPSG